MLQNIFGSKARVRIMKAFLSQAEQKYYTRQLARDLSLQVNSVRRELENLLNIGLIKESEENDLEIAEDKEKKTKSKSQNEKKYFVANTDFLLFYELKQLFSKANLLSCQSFIDELKAYPGIKRLWLGGIFTGELGAQSDILLVGKINKTEFLKKIKALEEELEREINYTIMDEAEFEYRQEIHDIFLYRLREDKHLEVITPPEVEEKEEKKISVKVRKVNKSTK